MNMRLVGNGRIVKNATWSDVKEELRDFKKDGVFRLSIWPPPESGPEMLNIEYENGYYMPTMLNTEGGIYRFYDPEAEGKEKVEVGGYEYEPIGMTRDYDLIVRMIKEFFHTGNVPPELWEPQTEKS